jgi:hypothetical protein
MTASVAIAQEEIWRNERGNIEMSPSVFMERERYILELETKTKFVDEYRAKLDELALTLNEERKARNEYERSLEQKNFRNTLMFFGAGMLIGAIIND